jgi:hypothetical protein
MAAATALAAGLILMAMRLPGPSGTAGAHPALNSPGPAPPGGWNIFTNAEGAYGHIQKRCFEAIRVGWLS